MYQNIKDRAKQKISKKIVFLFIISFIPVAISAIFAPGLPFIGIFTFLVGVLLTFGVNNVFLKVARTNQAEYKDILVPFTAKDIQRFLVTGLLSIMWILLYSLLLIVPGIIKAYEYSQVFYIALDKPNLTPKEVLAESSKMMNGNKGNLFVLQLSFIGWALLVMITLGLANIYVIPFYQMSLTEFYLDLKNEI
jgi:uncharacterized membrane protein